MKLFKILLLAIIVIHLYSQEDSVKYNDCLCVCIKTLYYKTLPDSFMLGLKYSNIGANNFYEYFSIPESSLVKFNVNDISFNPVKGTEFCLLSRGNYQLSFYEMLKPIEEVKSGVYYLLMTVNSPQTNEQIFIAEKKFILVK